MLARGGATLFADQCYQLTSEDSSHQVSALWSSVPVHFDNSFDLRFMVYMGCEAKGGEGMAFVMQREFVRGKAILDRLIAEDNAPLAYYARAVANHGLGLKAEAQSDIDNAARLAPADANIREWQGRIRGMK